MPPSLRDPLPYRIGDGTYAETVEKAAWVSRQLDKRGALTGVNNSLWVIARALRISPQTMRRLNRRLFMAADAEAIPSLVQRINAVLCTPMPNGETNAVLVIVGRASE